MRYRCVDSAEYLYPDVTEYKSGSDRIDILSPRGSYACAQILFYEGCGSISVACEGWQPEIYEMKAIPVERNSQDTVTEEKRLPHMPERIAPFWVYDCLKPYGGSLSFREGACAVYFSMWIPTDAQPGIMEAKIRAGQWEIPVRIEVSRAQVPEESLAVLLFYNQKNVCSYHHVEPGSAVFEELDTAYLTMLRRMRQNALSCPGPEAVPLGDNRYEFDFTKMEAYMEKAISLGFGWFYCVLGARERWDTSTIFVEGLPSMSFEGYCYLAQYLPALAAFLEERGWTERLLLSVSDEPTEANATEYRALCGLVRRLAPDIRLIEASSTPVYGALDIYVPLSSELDRNREKYETLRRYGGEIWYYDCCVPREEGYMNRFMDYPLLSTRYHGWANYANGLKGYLHWAANNYQPGQDPFVQSCPPHTNVGLETILPAGDTHIMYPGESGPWMSVRLESQRAGAEEYEMLRAVAATDKELADSLCARVFRSFRDVAYDPLVFRETRNALVRAVERI